MLFLVAVCGSAFGQAYECRTPSGNIVQQYGQPCAPGTDARNPARESQRRNEQAREADKARKANELEAAVMRREVRVGMTPEQVQRTWGNPSRSETTENEDGKTYTWYWRCYDRRQGSNAVVFRNGLASRVRVSCS
jgi:hypothetical protein